jgi:hypothetical protein
MPRKTPSGLIRVRFAPEQPIDEKVETYVKTRGLRKVRVIESSGASLSPSGGKFVNRPSGAASRNSDKTGV